MHKKRLLGVAALVAMIIAGALALEFTSVAKVLADPKAAANEPAGTSAAGRFLGPEIEMCCSDDLHQEYADLAYNRNRREYLVVFHGRDNVSRRLVSGARVSVGGNVQGLFPISLPRLNDCCLYPTVAHSRYNDEYLVVWQNFNASQNKWEIYGRIIPGDGSEPNAEPFPIVQWTGMNLTYPVVAWNSVGNEYMVVWQTTDLTGLQALGIGRRRVDADGTLLGNADYITQSGFPSNPDIAYNPATDQYLVVWAQVGNNVIDIYGGRLNAEGALQGTVFPISEAAGEQQLPAVTTNEQNRYLVVWQDNEFGDWDINGQFLDANGVKVVGAIISLAPSDDTHPDVVANGLTQQYVIVWQNETATGQSIMAEVLNASGALADFFELVPGGLGDNTYPTVGTHLAGYFASYGWTSWAPDAMSDVFGRMWTSGPVFLPFAIR